MALPLAAVPIIMGLMGAGAGASAAVASNKQKKKKQQNTPKKSAKPASKPAPTPVNIQAVDDGGSYIGGGGYYGGGGGGGYYGGGGGYAPPVDTSAAERKALKGEIAGFQGRANPIFDEIFRRIDGVAKNRSDKLAEVYRGQRDDLTGAFQSAVPKIDNAFAAMGIGGSTYAGDRIDDTTNEYKSSMKKVDQAEDKDVSELGNWVNSQKAAFDADRQNINNAIARSGGVEDVGELRDARNNIDTTINNLGAKRGALNDDGTAVAGLNRATGGSSNFGAIKKAYEGVLSSAMDIGTKNAVKEALSEYGNLSDDEKRRLSEIKVNNPYNTPVA